MIGGRFDGQIFGGESMHNLTPAEFQARYGLDVVREEYNIRRASEVPPSLIPYAIVTPEGEWFDCESQRDTWPTQVQALLDLHNTRNTTGGSRWIVQIQPTKIVVPL